MVVREFPGWAEDALCFADPFFVVLLVPVELLGSFHLVCNLVNDRVNLISLNPIR